ncbi:MAG: hypothetical protein U9Q00_10670 [Synergistota bacterium]|nr:hypothetical protein [Synergistota bacterium]
MTQSEKDKKEERKEKKVFEEVAGATKYCPVTFQADIREAEENELVRQAEEKLFLHNIEVADKLHDISLDLSLDDLMGDDTAEEEKDEKEEA